MFKGYNFYELSEPKRVLDFESFGGLTNTTEIVITPYKLNI